MLKIALFDKPLEVDGNWAVPLTLEYPSVYDDSPVDEDGEPYSEPYAEGKYLSYASTPKGQQLQFKADVGPYGSWDNFSTEIGITFRVDGFMELTGTGEAYQIFATVTQETLKVFDEVRAEVFGQIIVIFATSDSSKGREKVYAKLAQGIARARGGTVERGAFGSFLIKF